MTKLIATVFVMALCLATFSWSQDQLGGQNPCREHPQVNGPCFKVHGRIRVYNGTPSVRIWPVGTNRLLGVSEARFYDPEYSNMPPDLSDLLTLDNEIFADFIVCPFTPDEPGVMRLVCIDSASNIIVRKIPTR
jgi:hypothetical protein